MPTPTIRPRPIKDGDRVSIVSTSSPVKRDDLVRLVGYFERRGHDVVVAPHTDAATGYLAGPAADRAADLMAAFSDPEVRLIMPAEGGEGAAQLLPLLNFELIAASRALFVGLSDTASLANGITHETGLVTLHGPTGHAFSQEEVDPYTEECFWRIVGGPVAGVEVDGTDWRVPQGAGVSVAGRVYGGHLRTVRNLIGTRFMPDLRGAVLIIEEVDAGWAQIDSALTHLRLAGVFDKIAALLVGVPRDCARGDSPDGDWDELVVRASAARCPIVTNAEFGHTRRKFGLGIGCRVELDLSGSPLLRYAEDVVAP